MTVRATTAAITVLLGWSLSLGAPLAACTQREYCRIVYVRRRSRQHHPGVRRRTIETIPSCEDLLNDGGSTNFAFDELNRMSDHHTHHHEWAWIRPSLLDGLEITRKGYGGTPMVITRCIDVPNTTDFCVTLVTIHPTRVATSLGGLWTCPRLAGMRRGASWRRRGWQAPKLTESTLTMCTWTGRNFPEGRPLMRWLMNRLATVAGVMVVILSASGGYVCNSDQLDEDNSRSDRTHRFSSWCVQRRSLAGSRKSIVQVRSAMTRVREECY